MIPLGVYPTTTLIFGKMEADNMASSPPRDAPIMPKTVLRHKRLLVQPMQRLFNSFQRVLSKVAGTP